MKIKLKNVKCILFLLGLFISSLGWSQNCKPDKYYKDKFAGVKIPLYGSKVSYSKSILFGNSMYSYLYLYRQDGKTKLGIDLIVVENQSLNNSKHDFEKGGEILLRTEKGIINLKIDEYSTSLTNSSSKTMRTYSIINYPSLETIKKLSQGGLKAFKLTTKEGNIVQEQVKSKVSEKLKNQFNCFLKLM